MIIDSITNVTGDVTEEIAGAAVIIYGNSKGDNS
jgi:hypothetical protein